MPDNYHLLRLTQLDETLRQFEPLRRIPKPRTGWIRAIRQALGMSSVQLARRLNVTQQAESKMERSERDGTISLASLHHIARALDCELVYALVPRTSLKDTIVAQARRVAAVRLNKVSHTMRLEAQGISSRAEDQRRREIEADLLARMPRYLWNEHA